MISRRLAAFARPALCHPMAGYPVLIRLALLPGLAKGDRRFSRRHGRSAGSGISKSQARARAVKAKSSITSNSGRGSLRMTCHITILIDSIPPRGEITNERVGHLDRLWLRFGPPTPKLYGTGGIVGKKRPMSKYQDACPGRMRGYVRPGRCSYMASASVISWRSFALLGFHAPPR